jgi:hypothetical protein
VFLGKKLGKKERANGVNKFIKVQVRMQCNPHGTVGLRSPRTVQYSFERTWRRRLDRDAEVRSRERDRDKGKE